MTLSTAALLDRKNTIIILQWLVGIVSSYLMLFSGGQTVQDPWSYGLVILFLITALALYHLPEMAFQHRRFDMILLAVDTLLISGAIYQNRGAPWDLFLLFFFVLFLAAIGETLLRIVVGFLLVSLLYLGLLLHQGRGRDIGADFFVRLAFLFGVSILYGYLSDSARKEKTRAEAAEQKERLKMDLVSALAHDIKSPLGIIMSYAEMVMDQLVGRGDEKGKLEILGRIQENAQRIVNLVTGFLEASKVEAGKLSIEERPLKLNIMLREIAQQQTVDLRKKDISLGIDLDDNLPEILADKIQLDRVFWNLISNAIKFTPAGGKVTISSRLENGYVAVAVKDTGMGIPQNEIPLLFSQFRRLKGAAKIEGTGLGLFIVKTIIEAHKGTVQVESVDGQGSTFTIRVPIRA